MSAAIAQAAGWNGSRPYFIDAGRVAPGQLPVGGLTVVRFRNAHLIYALTWFALRRAVDLGLVITRRQSRGAKVP